MRLGMSERTARGFALGLVSSLALACSAPPPPPVEPPPASAAVAPEAPPALDLSPVPAPSLQVATARMRSLSATLDAVGALGAAPPGQGLDAPARALIANGFGRAGVRLDVDAVKLASAIALDAPVDLVVALPEDGAPEPLVGVSLGLRSADDAKAAAGANLAELGQGVMLMTGERAKGACAVMPSAGPTPARLVCGRSKRDVEVLGPYLARTLSIEPVSGGDLVAEVDLAKVDARVGDDLRRLAASAPMLLRSQIRIGEPGFDAAAGRAVAALASELGLLLGDVDKLRLTGRLSPSEGLELDGNLSFRKQGSFISAQAAKAKNHPTHAAFARLPIDVEQASVTVLEDPADYAPMIAVAKELVVGLMASEKIGSDAERKKVAALLDFPFAKGTIVVRGSGHGRLVAPAAPKNAQEKLSRGLEHQLGWHLFGVTQKSDVVGKWLKDLAAASGQAGLQAALKKATKGELAVRAKSVAAPAKLGKGATAIELSVTMQGPQKKSFGGTVHLLAMSDGELTWIGLGIDRDDLVARLLQSKAGAPSDKTLAARADVAPLVGASATSLSFLSLESFRANVAMFAPMGGGAASSPEDELFQLGERTDALFASLPGRGETPMTILATTAPSSLRVQLRAPRRMFEDLFAIANRKGR